MKTVAPRKPGRPVDPELRDRRCEEILDAALKLFAEHGYSGADTQVLADQLGIGKGTLYRYFSSKERLFLAAVDRVMRRLRVTVDASIAGIDEPLEQIGRAVRAYLGFVADNPGFVEILIQERAHFKDRKKPTYFEHREANLERWRTMYRSLMSEGRIRKMPVDRITDVFGDLMYGTMFANYFTGRQRTPEEQAKAILDIMFCGILAPTEQRRLS
ncbi:MAG: TetR/AcrR family transcriptional regulator [Gemmataceae bacterium]|nr:TetR/AcrR family transcriptional regulator [Gemmataceae bacterium]